MVISGNMWLIVYFGYLIVSFKVLMIYNLWFVDQQVDVKVVLMGVRLEDYVVFILLLFMMINIIGVLVMMLYKIVICDLVQCLSLMVVIVGVCNVICCEVDGSLSGDMFDGEGFVLGLCCKGFNLQGMWVLVVGSGGVGLVIVVFFVVVGFSVLILYDIWFEVVYVFVGWLYQYYLQFDIILMQFDFVGYELVVNVILLGMKVSDLLLLDVDCLVSGVWVGEVVMIQEYILLLRVVQV